MRRKPPFAVRPARGRGPATVGENAFECDGPYSTEADVDWDRGESGSESESVGKVGDSPRGAGLDGRTSPSYSPSPSSSFDASSGDQRGHGRAGRGKDTKRSLSLRRSTWGTRLLKGMFGGRSGGRGSTGKENRLGDKRALAMNNMVRKSGESTGKENGLVANGAPAKYTMGGALSPDEDSSTDNDSPMPGSAGKPRWQKAASALAKTRRLYREWLNMDDDLLRDDKQIL